MDRMVEIGMSRTEVQYLKKAAETLRYCRLAVMHTFVFAAFLQKNGEKEILEDNQSNLEQWTEKLSRLLEKITAEPSLTVPKVDLMNTMEYCERRRQILTRHVHEGCAKETWLFAQ